MRMREARFKLMGGHLVGALALAICDFSKISVQVNKINNLRQKSDYIGKPGGGPTQSRGDQRSSGGGKSKRSGAQIFCASPLLLGDLWLWR